MCIIRFNCETLSHGLQLLISSLYKQEVKFKCSYLLSLIHKFKYLFGFSLMWSYGDRLSDHLLHSTLFYRLRDAKEGNLYISLCTYVCFLLCYILETKRVDRFNDLYVNPFILISWVSNKYINSERRQADTILSSY